MIEQVEKDELPTTTGLQTRNIFLDAQVYRQNMHDFNSKSLQKLLALINDHVVTLHITDITKAEIGRQIRDLASEVAQNVNKANRDLRRWQSRSRWKQADSDKPDVDALELAAQGARDFESALSSECRAIEHAALKTSAARIFERYFAREAPFDISGSKEFPDAFVIETLDQWCQENRALMYVITLDKGMQRAAEKTSTLLVLSSLDELLQTIAQTQHPDLVERAERMLNSGTIWEDVEKRIRDQVPNLGIMYAGDLYEGEVIDHSVADKPIELSDFHVVSVSPDETGILAKLTVHLIAKIQYEDTTDATYDKEDDMYFGAETVMIEKENEVEISVFIAIDPHNDELLEMEILTRELHFSEPNGYP